MPVASVEVLGTVRPDGSLELHEKLSIDPRRCIHDYPCRLFMR
jgi:hypothetical protein